MSELERALRAELEWAIGLLTQKGSPRPSDLRGLQAAIRENSPMLHRRMELAYSNACPLEGMSAEETSRLGMLLAALLARSKGEPWRLYQPGEFDFAEEQEGKEDYLQIRVPRSFKLRLRVYCERSGLSLSAVAREAIEAYLEKAVREAAGMNPDLFYQQWLDMIRDSSLSMGKIKSAELGDEATETVAERLRQMSEEQGLGITITSHDGYIYYERR